MMESRRSSVQSAVRVVLEFRLAFIVLTAFSLSGITTGWRWAAGGLLLAALSSSVLLFFWRSWGSRLIAQPAYLATEIPLASLVVVFAGPSSPFVYYLLFTGFFGGLLFSRRGAGALTAALVVGYGAALYLRQAYVADVGTLQDLVSIPAFIPLAALAGGLLQELFERQAQTDHSLQLAVADAAAERERGRLARNLHDSLAKSLQGIAMSAEALAVTSEVRPADAGPLARRLAAGARTASAEARAILVDLRASVDVESPFHDALDAEVRSWSQRSGTALETQIDPTGKVDPRAAQELLLVTREALRNVERHADASTVAVVLAAGPEQLVLSVGDDGRGFAYGADATERQFVGHFGLVGMRERVESVGGRLSIHSLPGAGTTVTASVPLTSALPQPDHLTHIHVTGPGAKQHRAFTLSKGQL